MPLIHQSVAPLSGRRSLGLVMVLAAQCMFAMDLLIVVVALPHIQQDLGFNPANLTWVLNGFGLAFGGLLMLGGRLGDMIGQVRAFRIGLVFFVLASLLGGLAQSPGVLVTARVLQGVGAALAGPSVLALVLIMARDAKEQAKGMSLFIAVSSIGASAGLILGGILTEFLTWRWSLLINVPVGTMVIIAIGRLVAETHPNKVRLDIVGAISATLGSVALVYGFISAAESGWSTAGTTLSFTAAAFLLVIFVRTEKTHNTPLLHLDLLLDRPRVGGLIVMALIVGVHFSVLFMLVQYFQRILGYTPLVAGLAYLPVTITVFVISHFVPRLLGHFGIGRLLVSGSMLVAASLLGLAIVDEHSTYFPTVFVPLFVHAVGIAFVFAPGTVAIMRDVPAEYAGAASGLLQTNQQIGGALGIAVITSIYALASIPGQFVPGLSTAFEGGAAIASAATVVAWCFFPRVRQKR